MTRACAAHAGGPRIAVLAAALGVAAVVVVALTRAQRLEPAEPPDLAVDASSECELLVCIRDILTSHWRDGDVMQVFSAYDALRVHAETIANGRGAYQGDAVPALRGLYD